MGSVTDADEDSEASERAADDRDREAVDRDRAAVSATYAPASVKNSPAGTMVVRKETSAATPRTIGWRQCSTARLPPMTGRLPRTTAKRHAKHRHSNHLRLTQTARSLPPADRPTATVDTLHRDPLAA